MYLACFVVTTYVSLYYSIPGSRDETHLASYITSELKIKMFCFFTIRAMMWKTFKSFGCTKIHKDSKWTKTSWNEVMQFENRNEKCTNRVSYSKCNFLFFNLELLTRKQKNKSLTIELVTWSGIIYFSTSS